MVLSRHMHTPARGFASSVIIIIVVLVLIAAVAGYYGAFSVPGVLNQAPVVGTVTIDAKNQITKDATHVYSHGGIVSHADPASFSAVDLGRYYKDAMRVWVIPAIAGDRLVEIPDADSATFMVDDENGTAHDARHRYSINASGYFLIDGDAPPPTFWLVDGSDRITINGRDVAFKEGFTFTLPQGWQVGTTTYDPAFSSVSIYLVDAQGRRGGRMECPPTPKGFEGARTSVASSSRTFTHAGVTYKASYSLDNPLDEQSHKPLYKKDDDMGNKIKFYDFFSFINEADTTYQLNKCTLVHLDVPQENVDELEFIYASWR